MLSSSVDVLLRELAIVRTGMLCGAEYEWRHHVPLALGSGGTEAQIEALQQGKIDGAEFDERQHLVLRFTTEVVENVRASDPTFAAMQREFSPREIIELILAIGVYMMNSRVAVNGGVTMDDDGPRS